MFNYLVISVEITMFCSEMKKSDTSPDLTTSSSESTLQQGQETNLDLYVVSLQRISEIEGLSAPEPTSFIAAVGAQRRQPQVCVCFIHRQLSSSSR